MRQAIVTIGLLHLASACGPQFMVVPRDGNVAAVAQTPTATLTAYAEQWESSPYDLADYVTPILVSVRNNGPTEVRVSYVDFALRDDRGTRYVALNPYGSPLAARDYGALERPRLYAQRSVGPPSGVRGGGIGGRVVVGPPSYSRGFSPPSFSGPNRRRVYGGYGGVPWAGFYLFGGARGFYGPGFSYWGGAMIVPTGYATWVYPWGPPYYPTAMVPSQEILEQGLPEGVLSPGGHATGFIYFQHATARGQGTLDLAWELHDVRTSADIGVAHVELEILSR